MKSKKVRVFLMTAMAGTMLQFGCLGGDFMQRVLANVVADQVGGVVGGFFNIGDLLGDVLGGGDADAG